jgi:hypothetical protein
VEAILKRRFGIAQMAGFAQLRPIRINTASQGMTSFPKVLPISLNRSQVTGPYNLSGGASY